MKNVLAATFVLLTATPLMAQTTAPQDPGMPVDIGFCKGPSFVYQPGNETIMSITVVFPEIMPMPENSFLMTFESDILNGPRATRWSDNRAAMPGHCEDTYYKQHAPKHGQWQFELTNMTLTGCPEMMDPTRGLESITTINWDRDNGPVGALDKFPYAFNMVRSNSLHFTATADQMPQLPGTILIVYDFKAINPDRIDVIGDIDINIKAGGMSVSCAGSLEMRGHPIP